MRAAGFTDRWKVGWNIFYLPSFGYRKRVRTDRVLDVEQRTNKGRVEVGLDALSSSFHSGSLHMIRVKSHRRVATSLFVQFGRLSLVNHTRCRYFRGNSLRKESSISGKTEVVRPCAFCGQAYALQLRSWHQWEMYAALEAWQGCRGEGLMQKIESFLSPAAGGLEEFPELLIQLLTSISN